jgi:hypothetical protein|tara:strand:+ start:2090 stop:2455 length:366 start_codon:yes stop_codon:yes gene_type:complete
MKIKDIIAERKGQLPPSQKSTLNRSNNFATSNDRYYDLNRVMMATAGSDGVNIPELDTESFVGRSNFAMPYTKQEDEMVKQACKKVGTNITNIVNNPSCEPDDTNKNSPIAQRKRKNKYGV